MNPRAKKARWLVLVIAMVLGLWWWACGPVHRPDGGWGLISESNIAPAFRAQDQQGTAHTLEEFRGRFVVLFFYPRDGTPGCTREACAFRDAWQRLAATGAQVLGVSTDDVASHLRFATQHQLPFPLLSDPEGSIAKSYGVRTVVGFNERVTFVIDPMGRIAKVYPNVDPAIHADDVVQTLRNLGAGAATAPTDNDASVSSQGFIKP